VHGPVADWDLEAIASLLESQSPDLVLVAVTPPTGEIVAAALFELLPGSSAAFVGVGGAVDMAVGIVKPTPESVSRSGLEWAWRLMLEPRRMWRRYLRDGLPTMTALLLAARRVRASRPREPRSRTPHDA
jgi:N-acetylglucosaminyldiphosphoundecaprenol N-acetyl-beta-D-mannosaminyltransferase